jgi:hypothetical protein
MDLWAATEGSPYLKKFLIEIYLKIMRLLWGWDSVLTLIKNKIDILKCKL